MGFCLSSKTVGKNAYKLFNSLGGAGESQAKVSSRQRVASSCLKEKAFFAFFGYKATVPSKSFLCVIVYDMIFSHTPIVACSFIERRRERSAFACDTRMLQSIKSI